MLKDTMQNHKTAMLNQTTQHPTNSVHAVLLYMVVRTATSEMRPDIIARSHLENLLTDTWQNIE